MTRRQKGSVSSVPLDEVRCSGNCSDKERVTVDTPGYSLETWLGHIWQIENSTLVSTEDQVGLVGLKSSNDGFDLTPQNNPKKKKKVNRLEPWGGRPRNRLAKRIPVQQRKAKTILVLENVQVAIFPFVMPTLFRP